MYFGIFGTATSQVGGEQIYNFLNVPTSARQAALGGEVLTLYDDVNQAVWNPSVINRGLDNQMAVNYLNFLADVNYGSVSYAHMFTRRLGAIHANATYVDYGKFIGADEEGNEMGKFSAGDFAFSVGYAYRLPKTKVYAGANLKFIQSKLENYTSNGMAVDFGLTYLDNTKPYIFSAVIRNLGYQFNVFDEKRDKLPLEISIGASYRLTNVPLTWHLNISHLQKWKIAVPNPSDSETSLDGQTTPESIGIIDNALRHFTIGAEFFPDSGFNVRLGYNFRRAKELKLVERRTFAGISAGFGLKMGRFKFNYAFTKYHPVANTSTFSINIDIAKN